MPKHLRLPRMDECQFYDKKRLEQLHRQEEQLFAEAKEKGDIPNDLTNYEVRAPHRACCTAVFLSCVAHVRVVSCVPRRRVCRH